MTIRSAAIKSLVTVALLLSSLVQAQDTVDVCDVSFLWPVPGTSEQSDNLISLEERLTENGEAICPESVFDDVMRHAEELRLTDPISNESVQITFPDDALKSVSNWKIAGIRVDPSAPGCSSKIRIDQQFGSTPQIRIIAQPVTSADSKALAHDFTMHLVFDYVKNEARPIEPDESRFRAIVDDLLVIKNSLGAAGIETTGAKLGVHPGFSSTDVDLTKMVREVLTKHLHSERLRAVAFMGLQPPEPWIFFATSRNPNTGAFDLVTNHPSLPGSPGQALSFVTRSAVFPTPTNHQFGKSAGVATDQLFLPNVDRKAFPNADEPPLSTIQVRHIADIVANPELSHFFITDCVSCHTESTLRDSVLDGATTEFSFQRPEGISEIDTDVLPRNAGFIRNWNVRNFGWGFQDFGKNMTPTVTMRTANEAAESADFINRVYLGHTPTASEEPDAGSHGDSGSSHEHAGVANALTLVMPCKDEQAYEDLKAKITAMLKSDDNPINAALDSIGNVHFARFVFFEKTHQVAVITSYDGDFTAYVLRFVDKIGDIFNLILEHVEGTDAMRNSDGKICVQSHPDEFLDFVEKHDLGAVVPFYSAYPDLTVQQIKQLQRMASE